ncbi:MAG: autotransporter adhesin family protein, partial [Treponema sp.]|nr:autotransporter adhesin family protein [Treponema sp.]
GPYPPIVLYGGVQNQKGTLKLMKAENLDTTECILLMVDGGAEVSLRDITLTGLGFIDPAWYGYPGFVMVRNNGTLRLETGGTITGNIRIAIGANGTGVRVLSDGAFIMDGGTISGNTAYNGGGVAVDNGGEFTMNGGTISGHNATCWAGGVFVDDGGTFTMNGGTISGNISTYDGGGVFVHNGGTFTMKGGTISGNISTNDVGGGVIVRSGGVFTKSGGSIIYGSDAADGLKNISAGNGQAVYVQNGSKYRNTTAGEDVDLDSATDANWGQ